MTVYRDSPEERAVLVVVLLAAGDERLLDGDQGS